MFFILSKVFAFLLSPFLWFLTSMLLFFFLKNEAWKRRFKYLTIALLLFFTSGFPLGYLMRNWEVPGKKIEQMESYDIGIVLSGMFEFNRDLNVLSVRRGADRIWQAISLYKAKKIKKVINLKKYLILFKILKKKKYKMNYMNFYQIKIIALFY